MKIWVSGAAGKLGSEVAEQLRRSGHEVTGVDRRPAAGVQQVDLGDPAAVAASLAGCEAIIHCAAIPNPEGVEPAELVRNNTMSTFNALEEAWKAGIRTAVLASSGSIYGPAWSPEPISQPYVPVDEDSPLQYVDPYALTKDFAERMGQSYARRGMAVTALRFHWIVGAAELGGLAARLAAEGETKNLWGYVELGDAARACIQSLQRDASTQPYAVLVIAADHTWADEPTADLLRRYFPDTEQRVAFRGRQGAFDISRARELIGWQPRPAVRGAVVDEQTRCAHWHGPYDVIAIKFRCCGEFYPCASCHDEYAGHQIERWPAAEWDQQAILCGVCGELLTINAYLGVTSCPSCSATFNPDCSSHHHLYFEVDQ